MVFSKKMKVLFVSSGNKKTGISPIVYNQGESLKKAGLYVDYFTINGKGWLGYFKHLLPLIRVIETGEYDIIHAHYSLCGFLATLAAARRRAIIVSLMGTFRRGTLKYFLIRLLERRRWKEVIVKSERMKSQIGLMQAHVIPNGVNIDKFNSVNSKLSHRAALGLDPQKKIVIFVSNPERVEKNFPLCKESVAVLNREDVELVTVYNKSHEEVASYMIAADVLMLTSFTEGSPNVVKEAMAANCPIVCTNVGDVTYLLHELPGTFIMNTFSPQEGAALLNRALDFGKRTDGLKKLISLGLTEDKVASRIISLYMASNRIE